MHRNYNTGPASEVVFFTGNEVEHTPAYGMKTLFVTGLQFVDVIENQLSKVTQKDINHIFFGANHSFNPVNFDEWNLWEELITHFLNKDYLCSLDIPIQCVENFNDGGLNEYDNFIPQIRVPIPYIKLWNYNTMLKIDDKDFKATNPGVWSHSLHTLMDRKNFTDWHQYNKDKIIK